MPKHAHHTFAGGGIAIWHITETPDELYALLATSRYDAQLSGITNPARRAEWLAVRLLVKELFGPDGEVAYHPTGRPYLKGHAAHISISHTRGYAAVAYHPHAAIGLDIEHMSSRVKRIASRFTSPDEVTYIAPHDEAARLMYYLINWSAKETLYKLYDTPSLVQFKEAFRIAPYQLLPQGVLDATVANGDEVAVHYHVTPDFVCTWAESLTPRGRVHSL